MTPEDIRIHVLQVIKNYPVKRVVLFGSRAAGTNREDSDADLIVEFSAPVSLMTLAALKLDLEEALGIDVDVVHGPVRETDLIEVGKVIELYAA